MKHGPVRSLRALALALALARALAVAVAVAGLPGTAAPAAPAVAAATPPVALATIVGLQARREVLRLDSPAERVTLTSLAPAANAWFLLEVERAGAPPLRWHLENPWPRRQQLQLEHQRDGVALHLQREGETLSCAPWRDDGAATPSTAGTAYLPLCQGHLLRRLAVAGRRTALEAATDLLRDHVWGGDRLVGFVQRQLFADRYVEHAASATAAAAAPPRPAQPTLAPAQRRAAGEAPLLSAAGLGLALDGLPARTVAAGAWQAVGRLPGVFASVYRPADLPPSPPTMPPTPPLPAPDAVEAEALAYLVAFDLERHELGFSLGTDHPRLGWSERVPEERRPAASPGPDGIDSAAPLVRTGMLAPVLLPRVVATFTGGFKREHGAFRHGALALRDNGSHYGFVEQGVVFSRLVPGLATLYVLADGELGMKTWTADDARTLGPRLRHARQNGVPLVEPGPGGQPQPGALVNQWGAGNWSGSSEARLRTLRAAACLLPQGQHGHLAYAWFSAATPPTMARVLQAYGCRYAMQLDMNALEHTYLAIYASTDAHIGVQHLVPGMAALDEHLNGQLLPRFLAFPDSRDFFYLLRREDR